MSPMHVTRKAGVIFRRKASARKNHGEENANILCFQFVRTVGPNFKGLLVPANFACVASVSVGFRGKELPLFLILALAPIQRGQKCHSLVFRCSPTPRKRLLPLTVPIVFFFALYNLRRNLKYSVWIKILQSLGSPSKEGVLVLLWFIIISLVFFYLNKV